MAPIPVDQQIIEVLKVESPSTVPAIRDRLDRPHPVEKIRQHCVHLAEKGSIRSLGQDIYASNGGTIEEKIMAILKEGPARLQHVVLAIWPELEKKPQEVTLTAIWYVRFRVDLLIGEGKVKSSDGKLSLSEAHRGTAST